jgi:UDP-N-acetyl-D-mannosaminuronic acid dehydrogenase
MDAELRRVCVVGIGRVGLPLALALQEAGLEVVGIDHDPALLAAVRRRAMPFQEPGFDELLSRQGLMVSDGFEAVSAADAVVVTVGTPLREHIETDLRQVQAVIDAVAPRLKPGALLCLRSTIAPGTTEFVRRTLEARTARRLGDGLLLAFCPERIAEGRARVELKSLPQIVGAQDAKSRARARELFGRLGTELLDTDFRGAELAKLFNNISRYVYFAVSNQLAMVAAQFGANIHEVLHLANHQYPRGIIAAPGLTAGTCLRKDFGMINEFAPYPDLLLSAWKVNEYVPRFLVEAALQRGPIAGKTVAVLGYTFKRGADDLRDSLAPKLVRLILREVPREVRICEPYLGAELPSPREDGGTVRNWPLPDALRGADVAFVATNHELFVQGVLRHAEPHACVVDLWNCTRQGRMSFVAGEVAATGGGGGA